MADEDGSSLRDRISRQSEEALGKLASDLLENPLVNSAITKAFSAREKASSAQELMETLMLGPNDTEIAEEYSSAIPSTLRLLSAREQSPFLYVDVTDEMTDLSGQGLLQALAQIVYTGSELEGVDRVQVTVNGDVIAWPKANLESSTEPLSVYDYPSSVRTAQPAYPSLPGA